MVKPPHFSLQRNHLVRLKSKYGVLYMCLIGFDFDRDNSGIMMEYIIVYIYNNNE